jgi:hypothetical protein
MTYDKVSDEVLRQVAEGSGYCYRHEGKAMARELIELRAAVAAASKAAPAPVQHSIWNGIP